MYEDVSQGMVIVSFYQNDVMCNGIVIIKYGRREEGHGFLVL